MSSPNHPNSTPSSFRSKLGSYVTGLAIGFLFLGFIMYQKHLSQQRDAQRAQQIQSEHHQEPGQATPAGQTP